MKQLVHIHGGTSWPSYEAYLQSLREENIDDIIAGWPKIWARRYDELLDTSQWRIFLPEMPNSRNAHYIEWAIWFEKYSPLLQDGVVLVGHSLGGNFLAKYLSENTVPMRVGQLHLVAAACAETDDGEAIFEIQDDLSRITAQCEDIFIYNSRDGSAVPFTQGEWFAERLPEAEFVTFDDRGHFLQPEFPELIERIVRA